MGNDNTENELVQSPAPTETPATEEPVKQEENRINNNPQGKGGFADHPELINRNGRPPKGWAWSDVLEEIAEEVEPKSGKTFRELVGRRIFAEAVNGNIHAAREIFNRMEGLPRIKMEVDGKIDTRIPELITILDRIVSAKEVNDGGDTVNQTTETSGDKADSQ